MHHVRLFKREHQILTSDNNWLKPQKTPTHLHSQTHSLTTNTIGHGWATLARCCHSPKVTTIDPVSILVLSLSPLLCSCPKEPKVETHCLIPLPVTTTATISCESQFLCLEHHNTRFFPPLILTLIRWLRLGLVFGFCLWIGLKWWVWRIGKMWSHGGYLVFAFRLWEAIWSKSQPWTTMMTTGERWIWRRLAYDGCLVREHMSFGILMSSDYVWY